MDRAYILGRRAYEAGESNTGNPYERNLGSNGQRIHWFNGWFDEWRWQKYGANPGEQYVPLHKISA